MFSENARHHRVLQRISDPIASRLTLLKSGLRPVSSLKGQDRTRAEVLAATNTALVNVCFYPRDCDTAKMRAIADRLEATKGAELDTDQGCLRLMAEIEAACPQAHDYVWFVDVRELQAEGEVAKLK